jgi:hypothetical protein
VSGASDPEVFFPAAFDVAQFAWNGNYGNWITIGRLKPGISMRQAEAQLNAIQADPQASLQQSSSRTLGSRQSNRLRTWLIGLQVFGCTALLLVTGLFSKSLLYLLHQEKGFETENVAIADVRLTPKTYGADQGRFAFDDAVLQNLRALPGVHPPAW